MQKSLFKDAIVWSKSDCQACESVKDLLAKNNYVVEIRNVDNPVWLNNLKSEIPGVKSVPQVMIEGRYIGGLNEVRKYLAR